MRHFYITVALLSISILSSTTEANATVVTQNDSNDDSSGSWTNSASGSGSNSNTLSQSTTITTTSDGNTVVKNSTVKTSGNSTISSTVSSGIQTKYYGLSNILVAVVVTPILLYASSKHL